MYAVVSSGGKQYRVEPGSTLLMERLSSQPGASILFDRVLLIGDGDEVTVGTPVVAGATVSGTILGEELGPKLVIFKFKQKVKYRRRTGHRQHLLRVRIDEINAHEGAKTRTRAKADAGSKNPEATAEEAAAPTTTTPKPRAPRARATKAKPEASVQAESASVQEADPEKPKPKRRAPAKPKAEKAEE